MRQTRSAERPGERARLVLLDLLRDLEENDQLPTVRELVKQHGASTETWRRMTHKLEAEGYLRVVASWGVFYTGKPIGERG